MDLFNLVAKIGLDDSAFVGGIQAASERFDAFVGSLGDARGIDTAIAHAIGEGGAAGVAILREVMAQAGVGIAGSLAELLPTGFDAAGAAAGSAFGRGFRGAFSAAVGGLTVPVNASGGGSSGGGSAPVRRNASAMASGRIFDRPTVFGYAEGAYQVAGDAGPEAVVGVGSLQSMIENAVRGAVAVTAPGQAAATRPATIVIQLNDSEVGRAFLPAIEAEQQRVGARFTRR